MVLEVWHETTLLARRRPAMSPSAATPRTTDKPLEALGVSVPSTPRTAAVPKGRFRASTGSGKNAKRFQLFFRAQSRLDRRDERARAAQSSRSIVFVWKLLRGNHPIVIPTHVMTFRQSDLGLIFGGYEWCRFSARSLRR